MLLSTQTWTRSQAQSTRVNKQTNKQKNRRESTITLFTPADTITHSLSHSLSVFTHPYLQTCLFAPCSALDKEPFWAETFLRESVRLCHPQEGSPRHADPTGDSGHLSGSLSTVSHSLVLDCRPGCLWFCTTHISAVHQKTSGSADVVQTGARGRGVHCNGSSLRFVGSCQFMTCK